MALRFLYFLKVSIHAPAWGATVSTKKHPPTHHRFNPRARVGRDDAAAAAEAIDACFNPRARVGRDSPNLTLATKKVFEAVCANRKTKTENIISNHP